MVSLPIYNIQLKAQRPNRKPYPKELVTYGDHLRKKRLDIEVQDWTDIIRGGFGIFELNYKCGTFMGGFTDFEVFLNGHAVFSVEFVSLDACTFVYFNLINNAF